MGIVPKWSFFNCLALFWRNAGLLDHIHLYFINHIHLMYCFNAVLSEINNVIPKHLHADIFVLGDYKSNQRTGLSDLEKLIALLKSVEISHNRKNFILPNFLKFNILKLSNETEATLTSFTRIIINISKFLFWLLLEYSARQNCYTVITLEISMNNMQDNS